MGLTCNVRLTPDSTCSYMCAVCDTFSFFFSFFFISIKCDLYINPQAVTPFFRFFNTFHCEAQLSACHLTFSTWTEITFHYFMNLVLVLNAFSAWHLHAQDNPENPGYLYLSQRVYLLSWGLKNGTVLFFMSLHYFILYDDYFRVYCCITDWMLLNVNIKVSHSCFGPFSLVITKMKLQLKMTGYWVAVLWWCSDLHFIGLCAVIRWKPIFISKYTIQAQQP